MADSLYLSLWFATFDLPEILPRTLSVLRQLPFSALKPGVTYAAVHPISWAEPTILERRFVPGLSPEAAVLTIADFLHEDYAYVFEAYWDLRTPPEGAEKWVRQPSLVRLVAHGLDFEENAASAAGHIQIDFGLDSSFLHEEVALNVEAENAVRSNVQRLVEFTANVEKNSGATGRLLWSESEENLAQKLINRLQKVN
ncbi:MAG: hypothetical protein ABSG70_18940 [Terriglobales bacterium]|jgi:hypothetical protein